MWRVNESWQRYDEEELHSTNTKGKEAEKERKYPSQATGNYPLKT